MADVSQRAARPSGPGGKAESRSRLLSGLGPGGAGQAGRRKRCPGTDIRACAFRPPLYAQSLHRNGMRTLKKSENFLIQVAIHSIKET